MPFLATWVTGTVPSGSGEVRRMAHRGAGEVDDGDGGGGDGGRCGEVEGLKG